ncbi:MAG: arginine--tRNA ligase [Candidatus Paceibacterota bacterium]
MEIQEKIKTQIFGILKEMGISEPKVDLEHPSDMSFGDLSANVAMVYAKELGKNPHQLAEEIASEVRKVLDNDIDKIDVAGVGFINFYLSPAFFARSVSDIYKAKKPFGSNEEGFGERIMIEYTNPNPFKDLHVGHLMTNTIGESLSRLLEYTGATVIRANYQGDVGPHVAKAIWGMRNNIDDRPGEEADLLEKVKFIGDGYVAGNLAYEKEGKEKDEIDLLNREVYEQKDPEIIELYRWGREVSLLYFESIYRKLGTSFDHYFFESQTFSIGMEIVEEGLEKGVFERSDGAVIFRGSEEEGLHTRVFVNSLGLPTYETKDLGLAILKEKTEKDLDRSIVVTSNEQKDYFPVMLKALSYFDPDTANKTSHIYHGTLVTPEGKMSSRKGNVLGGGTILEDIEETAIKKVREGGRLSSEESEKETAERVALSAFRYSVLKQATGRDVIFDMSQALSFEGDSGPYLQYSFTRASSVVERARQQGIEPEVAKESPYLSELERLLYRFPEVVLRSQKEYAPHYIATYLNAIASAFNNFYSQERIADPDDEFSGYKLLLTESFRVAMKNGLYLLGIKTPEKM